jgi:hypothetical protein
MQAAVTSRLGHSDHSPNTTSEMAYALLKAYKLTQSVLCITWLCNARWRGRHRAFSTSVMESPAPAMSRSTPADRCSQNNGTLDVVHIHARQILMWHVLALYDANQ